jgi:phosphatidylcholine synthase
MFALFAAAAGDTRRAFIFLVLAAIIDGTDGMLARRVKVWEVLPNFSGAYLDNAVDVLTYIFVPIFIMAWDDLLPHWLWLIIPTLAGMYAYGQINMKTGDHYFLGFPSYWNVIAIYLWWIRPGPVVAVLAVIIPALLTFVPTRWLYPSRNSIFWRTSWTLGIVWIALCLYLLAQEQPDLRLVYLSLFYPAYYVIVSFYVDFLIRMGARARQLEGLEDAAATTPDD